jgi:phosphoglycolate phosphatase
MARACGIDLEALRAREVEFRDAYLSFLLEEMARPDPRRRVLPGISPLLEALQGHPAVVLGLLTGNIEAGARTKLEPFRLNSYFPDGGFSSDHPDRPEIARIAREKLERRSGIRFETERVVVVGDTDQDVACARANGFRAIVVESGFVSRERILAARPDAHFADATDLGALLGALLQER